MSMIVRLTHLSPSIGYVQPFLDWMENIVREQWDDLKTKINQNPPSKVRHATYLKL